MILSTLAYIEKDNKYLMLHRNKKKNDTNKGKWLGIGGKLEKNESPIETIKREVLEETGLSALKIKQRGIITFVNSMYETEYIFLYTINNFEGEIKECNEGTLEWIQKEKVLDLNLWEGDKYFLTPLINNTLNKYIDIKFIYEGDKLIKVINN